jgi:hypothetical protein
MGEIRIIQRQPAEGNLVAFEKTAQIEAGAVPTRSDEDGLSAARLGREFLQAADALAGECIHRPHKLRGRSGDIIVGRGVELQDARWLAGSEAGLKLRPKDKRNLAEERAGRALSKLSLDPLDEFDDFDCPLDHDKESRRLALVDCVLAGIEIHVRSCPSDIRQ